MDDRTISEYSYKILENAEAANNNVELTNMPKTSKVFHETDKEDFLEKNFNSKVLNRC